MVYAYPGAGGDTGRRCGRLRDRRPASIAHYLIVRWLDEA
jgi:hypothetical protein